MFIYEKLCALSDKEYKDFSAALIPTVDKSLVLGVRIPILRNFAKNLFDTDEAKEFLSILPHKYVEENSLHALLTERIKDFDECVKATDEFLPYIDNWATCDIMSPKVFCRETDRLMPYILKWLSSEHTYAVRFGIKMLMSHYLDNNFTPDILRLVADVKSDEYYINMMIAWFFATALAKQYDAALPYIENRRLDAWTHNKAIQKCVESRRITDAQKEYLKSLKIKKEV